MPDRRHILRAAAAAAASITSIMMGGRMARAEEQIESPPYEVIDTIGAIQVRQYGPRIAAETDMAGPMRGMGQYSAFMALADFIFANNRAGEEVAMTAPVATQQEPIAMTAPVAMQPADQNEPIAMTAPVATQPEDAAAGTNGTMVMRFYMPSKYTMETLPKPGDERVRIIEVPAQTLAVLRFNGDPSTEDIAAQQQRLLTGVATSEWSAVGAPGMFGYDPPGTPPEARRNEAWVEVVRKP